jgi:hypothetical protein
MVKVCAQIDVSICSSRMVIDTAVVGRDETHFIPFSGLTLKSTGMINHITENLFQVTSIVIV